MRHLFLTIKSSFQESESIKQHLNSHFSEPVDRGAAGADGHSDQPGGVRLLNSRFSSLAVFAFFFSAFAAACSDSAPLPSQSIVNVSFSPTNLPSQRCSAQSTVFQLGSFDSGTSHSLVRVVDGSTDSGRQVGVACKISKVGDHFEVASVAEVGSESGGSVSIRGTFSPQGKQTGILSTFNIGARGVYEQDSCNFTYTNKDSPPVDSGRVWGVLECPESKAIGKAVGSDGIVDACSIRAEILFERCTK